MSADLSTLSTSEEVTSTPSGQNSPVTTPPPPFGDAEKAGKYITKLIDLINEEKIKVFHTDLQKFDLNSVQDHYYINLEEYEVEISHSKQPDNNKEYFVMIFNNIKHVQEGCAEKVVLAYTHLTEGQFRAFKNTADNAITRERKRIEEERFQSAIAPIDDLLNKLTEEKTEGIKPDLEEVKPSDNSSSKWPSLN